MEKLEAIPKDYTVFSITDTFIGLNYKKYYICRKNACPVCKHCTDIYWDYTNGPYMFICSKLHMNSINDDDPIEKGLKGECELFEFDKRKEDKPIKKKG